MDIAIKSIIGGLVIAGVLLLGKLFGPKVAGFVSAIPAGFVVAYIIFTIQNKNPVEIQNFLTGGIIAGIIFCLFIGVLLFTNKIGLGYWESIGIAYVLWGIAFSIFIYCK